MVLPLVQIDIFFIGHVYYLMRNSLTEMERIDLDSSMPNGKIFSITTKPWGWVWVHIYLGWGKCVLTWKINGFHNINATRDGVISKVFLMGSVIMYMVAVKYPCN